MKSFDSRNMITPLFLLQVTNACRQMPAGEQLEVITDDSGIATDLKRILAECDQGVRVVRQKNRAGSNLKIWLIKKPAR